MAPKLTISLQRGVPAAQFHATLALREEKKKRKKIITAGGFITDFCNPPTTAFVVLCGNTETWVKISSMI